MYEKMSAPAPLEDMRQMFSLPASPFDCLYSSSDPFSNTNNNNNNNNSTNNAVNNAVSSRHSADSSSPDSNKLDVVLYQESLQKSRMDFSLSGRRVFTISNSSSADMQTGYFQQASALALGDGGEARGEEDEDDEGLLDGLDEEMPFAWAQSDLAATASSSAASNAIVGVAMGLGLGLGSGKGDGGPSLSRKSSFLGDTGTATGTVIHVHFYFHL